MNVPWMPLALACRDAQTHGDPEEYRRALDLLRAAIDIERSALDAWDELPEEPLPEGDPLPDRVAGAYTKGVYE